MYIFPFIRIRYIKTIAIYTHIDCLNNSKCSVRDILLATKQGAFESVFGTFSVTTAHYFQVGFSTCFSGKDSGSSQWIIDQVRAVLKDEYDPSEGEDKIKLLEDFQNNKMLNAKVNITEWSASLSTQVMKLNKLNHQIDVDYLMPHILESLPQQYSTVVDPTKIDWRSKVLY